MADKPISGLPEALKVKPADLFVLEQDGSAKRLSGDTLVKYLLEIIGGHGGIVGITKVKTEGLVDTYRITLMDQTTSDFSVTNGRSIVTVKQTAQNGLERTHTIIFNDETEQTFKVKDGNGIESIEKIATVDLLDTYSIKLTDGTSYLYFVKNGAKGEQGDSDRLWVRYASQKPTESSHSFGELPDEWIGIASGTMTSAPEDWRKYTWYRIRGDQGEVGPAPKLTIGKVTTVEPDVDAAASITGSAAFPVLNLSIPRGRQGADGENSANWEINDPSSDGYVQGRTHYVKEKQRAIVNDRISFVNNQAELTFALEVGNFTAILVDWNGIKYSCQMRNISHITGKNQYAFGNLHTIDDSYAETKEPFAFLYDVETQVATLQKTDVDNPINFTLYYAEIVEKLDNKFLDADWIPKRNRVGLDGIILPETEVYFTGNQVIVKGIPDGAIEAQCRYRVTFNGVSYDAVCYVDDDGALGIGNSALAGLSKATEHPFYISSYGGSSVFLYKQTDTAQIIPFSIVGLETYVYDTLPKEYLPGDFYARLEALEAALGG